MLPDGIPEIKNIRDLDVCLFIIHVLYYCGVLCIRFKVAFMNYESSGLFAIDSSIVLRTDL